MSSVVVGTAKPSRGIRVANFVTATRPDAPTTGLIIYNTETEQVECWDGEKWFEVGVIPPPPPPPDLPTAYKTLVDAAKSAGTLLYVDSATGNDDNTGTTYDKALASISKAVQLATNGYTIYVMPGRHINMDTSYLRTGRSYGHGHLDDYGKQITFIGYPGRTVIGDEDPYGCTNGGNNYCGNASYGPYCGGMINANSKAIGFIVERNRPGNTNAVAGQAMFSQDAGGYTSPTGLRGEYLNCVFRNITNVAGDGTYNNGTTYAFKFNNGIFECPFTGNNYQTGNSGSTMSGVGYTRNQFPTTGMGTVSQALVTLDAQWKSSNTSYGVYVGTYAWDETMVLPYPGATSPTLYSESSTGGSSLILYNTWGLNNSTSSTGNAGTPLNDLNGATFTTSSKLGSHALSFDGSNDYVRFECPNANNTWSVGFWIYWRGHNSSGRSYLVDFRPSGEGNSYWLLDSNNTMTYLQANGSERTINFTPSANAWEHYALVSNDGGVAKIYRNGSLIDTGTQNGDTVGGNANLGTYFGARGGSGNYFTNAIIDEFFFHSSALTASQVLQIYNRTESF